MPVDESICPAVPATVVPSYISTGDIAVHDISPELLISNVAISRGVFAVDTHDDVAVPHVGLPDGSDTITCPSVPTALCNDRPATVEISKVLPL